MRHAPLGELLVQANIVSLPIPNTLRLGQFAHDNIARVLQGQAPVGTVRPRAAV